MYDVWEHMQMIIEIKQHPLQIEAHEVGGE